MLVRLYRQCDMGMAGMRYPDGGAPLDQPLLLLDAFAVIGDQFHKLRELNKGAGNGG